MGDPGRSRDTLTASPGGMQKSYARELQVGAWAGSSNARKSPSVASDEAGTWGCHGVRPGKGGKYGGRREHVGGATSGVRGNKGGCEASGVDPETHRVGEGERGRKSSRVAEKPGGGPPQSGQGIRVASGHGHPRSGQGSQGGQNPRRPHSGSGQTGVGQTGAGGRVKKTHPLPEQPGCRKLMAPTTCQWEDSGRRSCPGAASPPEWQKNPGGGRHRVDRGFELPQGMDTPGVAKGPRGDKTPGGPTAAQDRPG